MSSDPLAKAQVYHANLQVLTDLTAIAMDMARAVRDQVMADAASGQSLQVNGVLGAY